MEAKGKEEIVFVCFIKKVKHSRRNMKKNDKYEQIVIFIKLLFNFLTTYTG